MEELMYRTAEADDDEELLDPFCDPDKPVAIKFSDVKHAEELIKSGIVRTPCNKSRLSDDFGINLFLKMEFQQFTGSFKERGARYTMLMLDEATRKKGIVSASLGNHAQAVSYHGLLLNIPVTVVMPVVAPIMKISKCRDLKATVVVQGKDMAEAKKIALRIAKTNGSLYINGYDHPHVLAGQGTAGLEILEQVPNVDAVVIPAGGGGLIAGVAVALKELKPSCKIIGVESENCPGFSESVKAGKPTLVQVKATLADGLAVPFIGVNSFKTAFPLIDKMLVVKEQNIASGILRLIETQKCIVEGAGASGLAAVIGGQLDEYKGKNVVLILSGGNIDTSILGRCMERGLAADQRLVKIIVTISDRPAGIAELTKLIASIGVSIKDVFHSRAWVTQDVFSVQVTVICETQDAKHAEELKSVLQKTYKKVEMK
ncbi:hypothetical protein ILUMI_24681 [Ignelater luminosus]|uniref:L-serine deaminase n=1 Tax=Ignelater luminosus TaxID=2038154 RepID=A0A8K0C6N2_IGNLU|nr:hypothetical protein ILUMI_24681 [Ignelater luminosus]